MGGGALPNTSNGSLNHSGQPANTSRVGLQFAIPRTAQSWSDAVKTSYKQRRSTALTPKKPRRSVFSNRRKPQWISEGLLGGSISIYIYQGASLALTQGPFTAGTTSGASDFYCAYSIAAAEVLCTNYSPVFAPYGNDSFYVAMYDSNKNLLSITPGFPGTNVVQATQPTYTITSSGYASPISITTYAVASYLAVDAPTSCVDPSGGPYEAAALLLDSAGYQISGPLANPVTVNTTNFALYNLYGQQVSSPYTITNAYGAFSGFDIVGYESGQSGSVSVSATGHAVGINLSSSTTMNLYTVDRLALSPSTSGITVLGLVDSGPSAINCGTLPMGNYATGAAITSFSNPVAIGEDDYLPGAAVLDSVSGTPVVSLVDLDRFDFGDFLAEENGVGPFVDAVPVEQVQVPGHNPLALATSPTSGVGSGNIYILNADGSIQILNDYTNFGQYTTLSSAGTIGGPVDIANVWNLGVFTEGEFVGDYVFATSSSSTTLYEIVNADTSPSMNAINLTSVDTSGPEFVNPATYAVSADNVDGYGYLSFVAFDSGNSNADEIGTCTIFEDFCQEGEIGNARFGANATLTKGQTTFNFSNSALTALAADGTAVVAYGVTLGGVTPTPAPFPAFGTTVTQMTTTYDGVWNSVSAGGTIKFFYNFSGTASGSLSGSYATIVSPYDFIDQP